MFSGYIGILVGSIVLSCKDELLVTVLDNHLDKIVYEISDIQIIILEA